MRIAATVCAVVLVTSGCASRQNDPTAGVSRSAAPVNYETTVTSYFDLTTRTPPAQRKLSFSAPETTNCRILASSGGHLGWVVPVMYEASAPPPSVQPAVPAAPARSEATQSAKAAPPAAKGKAASAKQKKGATAPVTAANAPGAPTSTTAVGTVVAMATPTAGTDTSVATLDNVSVTGKTRYFFWFDRETVNAVTKRMDICP